MLRTRFTKRGRLVFSVNDFRSRPQYVRLHKHYMTCEKNASWTAVAKNVFNKCTTFGT